MTRGAETGEWRCARGAHERWARGRLPEKGEVAARDNWGAA